MRLPKNISNTQGERKSEEEVVLSVGSPNRIRYRFMDFEDEKKLIKYIKKIENIVRSSQEYKDFIKYLKEEQEYTQCAFFREIDIREIKGVGIEFHHYPFSLFDITSIVLDKESHYRTTTVNTFDIANEIMRIHYDGLVGLVPLSKTLHDLAHDGEVFINFSLVSGDVKTFMENYNEFIPEELKEKISVLENLSEKNNDQANKFILKKIFQTVEMDGREIKKINVEKHKEKLA